MGKGGGKGGERGERTEAEHTWLSVEGERYDVQTFRHPGGKHLLRPWLGRDATAPFAAFHPNPEVPRKYLRGLRAKEAAAAATPSAAATPETDLQAVIDRAKEQGWFKPSAFFYAWNISSLLLLEALAWLVLNSYGTVRMKRYHAAAMHAATRRCYRQPGDSTIVCPAGPCAHSPRADVHRTCRVVLPQPRGYVRVASGDRSEPTRVRLPLPEV